MRKWLAWRLFGDILSELCAEHYDIGYQSGRNMMASWLSESLDRATQQMIDSDDDAQQARSSALNE